MNNSMRRFCYGKIHRCTITEADIDYIGSITIDPVLLVESGIMPYTEVDVVNITNGARLQTYVIPGEAGKGEICLNGAAAHLFSKGDLAIIMGYEYVRTEDLPGRIQNAVMVDAENNLLERFVYTVPTMDELAAGNVPSRAHELYSERVK